MKTLMKCGHSANAINTKTGQSSCVICAGLTPDADIIDESPPDLTGRKARCVCGKEVNSDFDLAFFEYCGPGSKAEHKCKNCSWRDHGHPSQGGTGCYVKSNKRLYGLCEHRGMIYSPNVGGDKYDSYYCGCMGWD